MTLYIRPIVEGHTEVGCIERLLHRIWNERFSAPDRLHILEPSRGKRDLLLRPEGLIDKLNEARIRLRAKLELDPTANGGVLLLLDAEDDCPRELASNLQEALPPDLAVSCVFAKRMFENWIVAGITGLAGRLGLPDTLTVPVDVEAVNGTKWLETHLKKTNPRNAYKKRLDAIKFVKEIDLDACRANSPSFDKLCRDLGRWIPPIADGNAVDSID